MDIVVDAIRMTEGLYMVYGYYFTNVDARTRSWKLT